MTKRIFIAIIAAILTFTVSQAKELFPDSETAKNDVELGVEGIARLCPTGLWDHWTFRDIVYDRDSNTVVFVIQLNSWREPRDGKEITEADAQKQTEWIVENIMEGYNELKQSPRIKCDGDFMLYLSLGTLLNQMEKDGATLRIFLMKPDYENLAVKDIPMALTSEQIKHLINN